MDLTEPGVAFAGTLTIPIVRALSGRSQPASAAQVARLARAGTPAGIRRALERLALHGVCRREELGGRALYSLNHDHVLYPTVRSALDAHDRFVRKLRDDFARWEPLPVSAVLFGSAARADGDTESDIDLLLVHPEMRTRDRDRGWARQIDDLRGQVFALTGNRLQVVDWALPALRRFQARGELLIDEILRDGITLVGASPSELLFDRQPSKPQARRR